MNRPFTDLDGHWAKDCIEALAQQGQLQGYEGGTFRPDRTVTRAEFSALLKTIFPDLEAVRPFEGFSDVADSHWAYEAIRWAVERGFFTGYGDHTFQPDQTLRRSPALAILVGGLKLGTAPHPDRILDTYFDDHEAIEPYFRGPIATATLNRLVVNVPDVRQLRPQKEATRAEVAAFIAQALGVSGVPSQYIAWSVRLETLTDETAILFDQLRAQEALVRQIQIQLSGLGLYPGGNWIDGKYGSQTEAALSQFCQLLNLPNMQTRVLDEALAQGLLSATPADFKLESARDRQQVFQEFYDQEVGHTAERLAFLSRGYQSSPYSGEIAAFPDRLKETPDGQQVISYGTAMTPVGGLIPVTFTPFPKRGELPTIDETALSFLNADIKQACVCTASFVEGDLRTYWKGRNALANVECWSTTKTLAALNVVCQANTRYPATDIDTCWIRPQGRTGGYRFHDVVKDIFTYDLKIASSNSLAYMLKQFNTPEQLEAWVKDITGNRNLTYRGRYGEPPFLSSPELWDERTQQVILTGSPTDHRADNSVSAYDLTRFIAMLGWHLHLPPESRLPGAQWDSLESMVRAFATDDARYLDAAIARLGLDSVIRSPVILSKLGNGRSSIRDRTEIVYVAFCQFVDKRPKAQGKPAKLRAIAMMLLAAADFNNYTSEALHLDARMAAEVTEIVRRLMTEELI